MVLTNTKKLRKKIDLEEMSWRIKCAIVCCNATTAQFPERKMLRFPKKGTKKYNDWLAQAEESRDNVENHKRPYICSKHFDLKFFGKKN